MYRTLLETLRQEVSGVAAKNVVARISQWHRIQASPMYREAATWGHATLSDWGLDTSIEAFPAREGGRAWGEPMFQEWWCDEATLHLVGMDGAPQILADYRAVPLSLMPRSAPVEGEFEVVVVDGGERPGDYDRIDVRGKLVLTRSMPMAVHHLAIERFGAAGLIFDGMRSIPNVCPSGDLQDDIQYASWWWWGGETRAFGFALSPRAGNALRQEIERGERSGARPVHVRAVVRSHFADGNIEAVTAVVPGESDEQVLIVGHLCHPAPFANDNASGAAAVMEAARALHTLIASGRLPRPRRSIRFLWIPEMTGTYAYLAAHEDDLPRTIAGLNLDMVGEDQAQCGSSSLLVRTSEALPSFASDLLETLREGLYDGARSFGGNTSYALFRHEVVPYANGSDHYIMADPSVGIPTPMLIDWPDRFYHTTADTLEKVSPDALARAAAIAGTYAYFVANVSSREVSWLAREMNARFEVRLGRDLQAAVTESMGGAIPTGPTWARRVAFHLASQEAALESLRRLDPDFDPQLARADAQSIAETAWTRSEDVLADWQAPAATTLPDEEGTLVPVRRYRGPVSLRSHLRLLSPEERDAADQWLSEHAGFMGLASDVALYWADGQRTLAQILDLVELETGMRDPGGLTNLFKLLERLELIELRS